MTVSKAISGPGAKIVQEWVANRVRLESIVDQMKAISHETLNAASLLLQEQSTETALLK